MEVAGVVAGWGDSDAVRDLSLALGPGDLHVAHSVDEYVPVEELLACAQALALTAMRFCGTS